MSGMKNKQRMIVNYTTTAIRRDPQTVIYTYMRADSHDDHSCIHTVEERFGKNVSRFLLIGGRFSKIVEKVTDKIMKKMLLDGRLEV